MFGDEADHEAGRGTKFIVYGGVMIDAANAVTLSARVQEIRQANGFGPQDPLKFASRNRPPHLTAAQHTLAKQQVLDAAAEHGALFTAYAALHALIANRTPEERITFAVNTVIKSFHSYLEEVDDHGIVFLDRMPIPIAGENTYLREKFQIGLVFNGRTQPLSRVLTLGSTCDGASHMSSVADIVLGSFRYCVNEEARDQAGRAMFPQIVRLMWSRQANGQRTVLERGLILRPMDVRAPEHQAEYESLKARLRGYLA